jgi:hypothetical protein
MIYIKTKVITALNLALRHEDMWRSGSMPTQILQVGTLRMVSFTFRPFDSQEKGSQLYYKIYLYFNI